MTTTRRSFLKQTGLVTAGTWLLPSFAQKPKAKDTGIQLWTVRDILERNPAVVLEKVAGAGYKNVEPYGFSRKNNFWGKTAREIKTMLLDNGLKSTSGHYDIDSYFHNGDTKDLMACILAANTLGSEYLTIPSLGESVKRDAETCKNTAHKMNEAGKICKKEGLKLAYHNHNTEFRPFGDTYGYEIFLKESDPALVHFEMDLYWLVRAGKDPVTLFSQFPGRFSMWHVKDMDKNDKNLNTEIGKGSINFESIFAHAKEAGMEHFFVEQENNYQPDIVASIQTSYNYIKKSLIKKLS